MSRSGAPIYEHEIQRIWAEQDFEAKELKTVDGRPIQAVAQVTKHAFTFVFDRVTGEPVWPIEERTVPPSTVPGEWTSPTQPFPTKPPPFDLQGIEIDDLTGIGPYSVYPRTSGIEANQIVNLTGAQYTCGNYRANTAVVFQNKVPMCQYRAVGHPIATAVTEGLVDAAAAAINMDPIEVRKENLIPDDAYPCTAATGLSFEGLSHHAALDRLVDLMDYTDLRAEQTRLHEKGIYRGIGIATFIELTNPSAMFYGVGGARISAQDGCTLRLDAKGNVICTTSVTEQGQGAEAVMAQITATSVGVPIDKVRIITGDTDVVPYGGGTWASRAAGIGGEAAVQAGKGLRENILKVAGIILQAEPETLDIREGRVVDVSWEPIIADDGCAGAVCTWQFPHGMTIAQAACPSNRESLLILSLIHI